MQGFEALPPNWNLSAIPPLLQAVQVACARMHSSGQKQAVFKPHPSDPVHNQDKDMTKGVFVLVCLFRAIFCTEMGWWVAAFFFPCSVWPSCLSYWADDPGKCPQTSYVDAPPQGEKEVSFGWVHVGGCFLFLGRAGFENCHGEWIIVCVSFYNQFTLCQVSLYGYAQLQRLSC